jgi:hypothetical protein
MPQNSQKEQKYTPSMLENTNWGSFCPFQLTSCSQNHYIIVWAAFAPGNELSFQKVQFKKRHQGKLSSGGPNQLTMPFVLFSFFSRGQEGQCHHGHVSSGQERSSCLLKMSSIHNCAFSEFGCSHFLGRC